MIKKLRIQFITLALVSLLIAVLLVTGIVGAITFSNVSKDNDFIIDYIIENDGHIHYNQNPPVNQSKFNAFSNSPEAIFETRFISAHFNDSYEITDINVDNIYFLNSEAARNIIEKIITTKDDDGVYKYSDSSYSYKYVKNNKNPNYPYLIVLIDITSKSNLASTIFYYMLGVSGAILAVYAFIYTLYSRKVVKPYIEAQASQKRFITNASHELKTPLAVISANTEMIEAINGENKWTQSNLKQINKMNELIKQLVTLSKLNEKDSVDLSCINISKPVEEAANTFGVVINNDGKIFEKDIDQDIHINGDEKAINQLTTILLDNAAKYCDENGTVSLSLKPISNNKCKLSISNDYAEGKDIDCSKFFERFYRQDESHNNKRGGFGIGLSIALQLAEKHNSKLEVEYKEPKITFYMIFKMQHKSEKEDIK